LIPAASADEAADWLDRAAEAAQKQNYVGTIIYQHGGRFETSRLVHLNDQGREYEKLVNLDGPAREVIRVNGEVRCYYPDTKVIRIEPRTFRNAFPSLSPQQQAALTDFYTFRKAERERVAGIETQAWVFEPKGRAALRSQVLGRSRLGAAGESSHLRRAQRDGGAVRVHRGLDRREDRSRPGEAVMAGDSARLAGQAIGAERGCEGHRMDRSPVRRPASSRSSTAIGACAARVRWPTSSIPTAWSLCRYSSSRSGSAMHSFGSFPAGWRQRRRPAAGREYRHRAGRVPAATVRQIAHSVARR
jgi:hypothetical protein